MSFQGQSAAGILSLLDEQDNELKLVALRRLEQQVDHFWPEISESLRKIEALYEDEIFENRDLAALLCSKVYHHLGEFDESLQFALGAGKLFDVNKKNDNYVDTIIAKCIDSYIQQSVKQQESAGIDKRLQDIVERMFDRCFSDGEFKQALGIAIESRRLDKVEESINKSGNVAKMLSYCFDIAMNLVTTREFRNMLLRILVKLYLEQQVPDYFGVSQCLMFLGDYQEVANILKNLIGSDSNEEEQLIAYQIAFDLQDRAPQSFLTELRSLLPQPRPTTTTHSRPVAPQVTAATGNQESVTSSLLGNMEDIDEESSGDHSEKQKLLEDEELSREKIGSNLEKLHSILSGQLTISLNVDFLFRHNKTDLKILQNIKGSFERNSILHSATITANGYMHAGTTVDQFLRDNLEWLGKASNWAKFSATASLGVIHRGQFKDSLSILKPYLPAATTAATAAASGSAGNRQSSVYSEGGALFALGIIHSNHGDNMTNYLLNIVKKEKTHHVVQHGACLGLGLAAMATAKEDQYEALRSILFLDNALSGEAAGVSMGLVMLGTANEKAIEEMKEYAHETSHEKIIRGLAMGIALALYGREEEADKFIDELAADEDPIMRYGAMYGIGMAYCGTANNGAVRKLLQFAVSDVSDDVRRAAVLNLGFLLFKTPKQCPRLVSLLAESYNPHVRYGVAMALAISCAGTGLIEAVEILESLLNDSVDFVRQGALIALAIVLIQFNENYNGNGKTSSTTTGNTSNSSRSSTNIGQKAKEARKKFESVWGGREEIMTKVGSVLSSGIIDAGGRNVTILLHKNGQNKMRNIVGLMMFTQYWFWYPYLHFLSLSFEPTAIIGLNSSLKMPKFRMKSNARPSLFAYPAPAKTPEKQVVKSTPIAELSLTAKAKARDARRRRKSEPQGVASATNTPAPTTAGTQDNVASGDQFPSTLDEEQAKKQEEKKQEPEEPQFEIVDNPARVSLPQLKHITFDVDQDKFVPVKQQDNHTLEIGIVLLKRVNENEGEDLVELKNTTAEDDLPEPEPPAPFEWN